MYSIALLLSSRPLGPFITTQLYLQGNTTIRSVASILSITFLRRYTTIFISDSGILHWSELTTRYTLKTVNPIEMQIVLMKVPWVIMRYLARTCGLRHKSCTPLPKPSIMINPQKKEPSGGCGSFLLLNDAISLMRRRIMDVRDLIIASHITNVLSDLHKDGLDALISIPISQNREIGSLHIACELVERSAKCRARETSENSSVRSLLVPSATYWTSPRDHAFSSTSEICLRYTAPALQKPSRRSLRLNGPNNDACPRGCAGRDGFETCC